MKWKLSEANPKKLPDKNGIHLQKFNLEPVERVTPNRSLNPKPKGGQYHRFGGSVLQDYPLKLTCCDFF
jgi:hypothetical protein